jgi:arylsulfatase A-like enzyme
LASISSLDGGRYLPMETVDEGFLTAALDFIDRQHKAGKPFFVWFNSTRMHVFTHLKPESQGKTG